MSTYDRTEFPVWFIVVCICAGIYIAASGTHAIYHDRSVRVYYEDPVTHEAQLESGRVVGETPFSIDLDSSSFFGELTVPKYSIYEIHLLSDYRTDYQEGYNVRYRNEVIFGNIALFFMSVCMIVINCSDDFPWTIVSLFIAYVLVGILYFTLTGW